MKSLFVLNLMFFSFGLSYSQSDSVIILEIHQGEYTITNLSFLQNKTGSDTSLYPNPIGEITKFRFTLYENDNAVIDLSDTNNFQFLNIKLNSPEPGNYSINILEFSNNLPSGIYYVSIITSHQKTKKKIVIVK